MILALFLGPGNHRADAFDAFFGLLPLGLAELQVQLIQIYSLAQAQIG
jgi:hypothetical protein